MDCAHPRIAARVLASKHVHIRRLLHVTAFQPQTSGPVVECTLR